MTNEASEDNPYVVAAAPDILKMIKHLVEVSNAKQRAIAMTDPIPIRPKAKKITNPREQFDQYGRFLPFAETIDDGVDFDVDCIGKKIGLTAPQTLLLSYMLREIQIRVWYMNDEDNKSNPRLELCLLWQDMVVANCNLDELLTDVLESEYMNIENDQEIEVLEKLKARIDLAIAAHKVELP